MKKTFLFLCLISTFISQTVLASSAGLEAAMEKGDDAYKKARSAVSASDKDTAIKELKEFIRQMEESKKFIPTKITQAPEGQRPALIVAYKEALDKTIETATAAVVSVTEGDFAAAKTALRSLNGLKRSGHREFKQ